jgi:hypothetical protein
MRKNNLWLPLIGCCALGLMSCANAAELAPTVPTLTLEFEDGVNGIGRDGRTIAPRVEGKAEFVEGKFGKAFQSGPGAGYLYFPAPGLVRPQSGTVEMWVQPIDWSGDEKSFHSFFRATGKGELHLYKYFNEFGLLFLANDGQPKSPNRLALKNVDSWKPGQWHHIAATWSAARQELYIDGERVASVAPLLPRSLDKEILIGDHFFNPAIKRTSQSLIDRVRIYDRVLSPEVIAAHFAGDYDKTTPLSNQSAALDYDVARAEKKLTTRLMLLGADVDTQNTRVDFSIAQDERVAAQQKNRPFNGTVASADFSIGIPPGEYSLRATLHDAGGQNIGTVSRSLTIPSLEWMNNTIGKEKRVLPPWTPLEVQKNADGFSVKSWGREYRFGAVILPLQITAKGEPLLQSPVTLGVLADGKNLQWTNVRAEVKDASGYEVNITGSAEAATPQGRVLAETTVHIEYDGLMWLTLKLQAPPNFQPDAMTLDIPMREQNAIYRHNWNGEHGSKYNSGALPAGTGVLQKNAFQPLSWLGDNERGLFWFVETAQNWPNWKSEEAFQLRRENNTITTHLDLLRGQALPANWTFEFGLQATPVKPLPSDWRKWRLSSAPRPTVVVPWPSDNPDSTRYFGYPEARNAAEYQKMLDANHAKGLAVAPYLLLNGLSGAAPEWKWFNKEWDIKSGELGGSEAWLQHMTPTADGWQDFIIWKTKQFTDRFKVDGVYHDLSHVYGWAVPNANTGWQDGNEWHKTYPVRAYRELYRRNYALFKGKNPNSFLWAHNSPFLVIPMLAYEDAYLSGETLLGPLKGKDSYMDVMSLDQWRTEYTGRQWGVIPFILPEFRDEKMRATQPTRGLAALVMLHDTSVWPIWSNAAVWVPMFNALDAFGYMDSKFIPYWQSTPPATTDMKDVYISVYKRNDGRALAIVGNTSKEARSGSVTLNAKAIGLDTAGVLSWPDKQSLAQKDGKIEIAVPALDYRMLLIGKAP